MTFIEDTLKKYRIKHKKQDKEIIIDKTVILVLDLLDHSEKTDPNIKKYNKNFLEKYKDYNRLVFFSDEIINKSEIVKSMILSSQSIFKAKYRASELKYREFKPSDYSVFFDDNHIDGYTPSKFGKGLFLNDELICGMIFRRPNVREGGGWEIARFCTKLNTKVHGGASRLLSKWNEGLLVTYSNNRFSNGDVYKTLGFESIKSSKDLSYYYTDFNKRVPRTQCRKINTPSLSKLTEKEQAMHGAFSKRFNHTNPVYRIYDLGQKKWIYNKNSLSERIVYAYKFEDFKGRCYIGVSYDPEHRYYQHISDTSGPLYKAIQKYGIDSFKFSIICSIFGRHNSEYIEKILISQHNSYYNGYNRTHGGEGSGGGRKLKESDIINIKNDLETLNISYRKLGDKYNVSEVTIRQIKNGERWSYVGKKKVQKAKTLKQKSSKLTIEQVILIKESLSKNKPRIAIAKEFNISVATVDAIATGRNWNHVKVEGFKETKNDKCSNKMNKETINQIRIEYMNGMRQTDLAKKYDVSRTTIRNIVTYKTWK